MKKLELFDKNNKQTTKEVGRKIFKKVVQFVNKSSEQRQLELEHLIPHTPIDPTKERSFIGSSKRVDIDKYLNKVTVYFRKESDFKTFCKHVKVNTYQEQNTYDVELLITLLKEHGKQTNPKRRKKV